MGMSQPVRHSGSQPFIQSVCHPASQPVTQSDSQPAMVIIKEELLAEVKTEPMSETVKPSPGIRVSLAKVGDREYSVALTSQVLPDRKDSVRKSASKGEKSSSNKEKFASHKKSASYKEKSANQKETFARKTDCVAPPAP